MAGTALLHTGGDTVGYMDQQAALSERSAFVTCEFSRLVLLIA